MKGLRLLLIKNQSYLGKLRARAIYCSKAINEVEADTHKQYGSFAGYWDEWLIQAESMQLDIVDNITITDEFLSELRDFIAALQAKKKLTQSDTSYVKEVSSLAEDKLVQQKDLLTVINERIAIHKDFTKQLHLADVLDGLGDD
jgi:hypothetical protein